MKELEKYDKYKMTKKIHIVVIIIGIIFVCASGFHSNIWFDESYSVGMAERSFKDIWVIGGHDVHPVLYYWLLKIVTIIMEFCGIVTVSGKILAYRIFSMIPIIILGILGYTHIRKDWGEKTGILFSFLVFFLPEVAIYANEIRMYSWGILSVSILAIYAYRLKEKSSNKNWIIFFLSSIFSIFIHYYGLMAAGIINICLLIYFIKKKRKKDIIKIIAFGGIQAVSYIPWLMYFVSQLKNISHGFWIGFTFPDTIIECLSYQLIGNLNYIVGFIISILLYGFLTIRFCRYKGDKTPAKLALLIYLLVIIAAIVMTIILHSSILYYRYLFIITGLYIFTISFILSKEKNLKMTVVICIIILVMSVVSNIKMIRANYDDSNMKQYEYLEENLEQGDVIIYDNMGNATIGVYFSEYKQYFYNPENWGVEEAYKAFGENFEIVINEEFVNRLPNRIWIIDDSSKKLYHSVFENTEYTIISEKMFYTEYHKYQYNIILLTK